MTQHYSTKHKKTAWKRGHKDDISSIDIERRNKMAPIMMGLASSLATYFRQSNTPKANRRNTTCCCSEGTVKVVTHNCQHLSVHPHTRRWPLGLSRQNSVCRKTANNGHRSGCVDDIAHNEAGSWSMMMRRLGKRGKSQRRHPW